MSKLKKFNNAFDTRASDFVVYGFGGTVKIYKAVTWPFRSLGDLGDFLFLLLAIPLAVLVMAPFVLLNWITEGNDEK
jgi:hypothetical protein